MATQAEYIAKAAPAINRLKSRYPNPKDDLLVSDVVDGFGNQYVNLVQEGGGVLGIALLGYTYVLEQMGIRFMKMAGTSAGAINTMMLAALGQKHEMKSLKILELLTSKDLFDFVDGVPLVRNLIKRLICSGSFFSRMLKVAIGVISTFMISLFLLLFLAGGKHVGVTFWVVLALFVSSTIALGIFGIWVRDKRRDFLKAEFGLNPGNDFINWVEGILKDSGIHHLGDLRRHIETVPPGGFRMRGTEDSQQLGDLNRPTMEQFLVIVTSDITHQIKVEFPRMWRLYWPDEESVNPASFVRASMSVPVFFKPYSIPLRDTEEFRARWRMAVGPQAASQLAPAAKFVDGGMISNFPINVFYNPKVSKPRLPTFGVILKEAEATPPHEGAYPSFLSFLGAMLNTLRYHYDKEFLIKHADFQKTIGEIDVKGINWLNFNLSEEEKLELFRRGAEAAADFLLGVSEAPTAELGVEKLSTREQKPEHQGFDWEQYKRYRRIRKERLGY